MGREIDHIVYCVPDLEKGVDHIANLFGIEPVIGGNHLTKGTKNALLNLGKKCYLEILAIDEKNLDFRGERWMGIDLMDRPKITRWSLKSTELENDSRILSRQSLDLGIIDGGNRKTTDGRLLSWQMILPRSSPEVELLPFMTDWSLSAMHPTDSLAEGCFLESIELYHPHPTTIQTSITELGLDTKIKNGLTPQIVLKVITPNGTKYLQ